MVFTVNQCTSTHVHVSDTAGILRNLGHKKKERVRQESTLLYTPGALTWKVSIILRRGKVSSSKYMS